MKIKLNLNTDSAIDICSTKQILIQKQRHCITPLYWSEVERDEHMDPASKHAWPTNKTQQKVGSGPLAAGGPSKSAL